MKMKNQNLVQLPEEFSPDMTNLDLSDNLLTFFVFPNGYHFLWKLTVKRNQLIAFPDCRNVGDSLEELILPYNEISYVDPEFLSGLSRLIYLHLSHNKLTHFPDSSLSDPVLTSVKLFHNAFETIPWMPNFGKSLKSIQMGNNPLTELALYDWQQLTNFTYFGITNISVSTLPNLCHLPRITDEPFTISAEELTSLSCDGHLRWTKLINMSAPILSLDGAPCHHPPHLIGLNFSHVPASDMHFLGE